MFNRKLPKVLRFAYVVLGILTITLLVCIFVNWNEPSEPEWIRISSDVLITALWITITSDCAYRIYRWWKKHHPSVTSESSTPTNDDPSPSEKHQ